MRKKRIFLFFEIFIFTLFIGIFQFFPYITLVNFWFQATGHSFSPNEQTDGRTDRHTRKRKKRKNANFEKQKYVYFSHVPSITQLKN